MLPVLVLEQVCQEGREKKRSKGENGACLASIKQTDLITGSLASRLGRYSTLDFEYDWFSISMREARSTPIDEIIVDRSSA